MSKNSDPNFPSRSPPFPATTSIFISPHLRMIIFQNDADNVGIFVHNGSIRINQPNGSFTYATSLENRKRDAPFRVLSPRILILPGNRESMRRMYHHHHHREREREKDLVRYRYRERNGLLKGERGKEKQTGAETASRGIMNREMSIELLAERSLCRSNEFESRFLEWGLISGWLGVRDMTLIPFAPGIEALDMFNDIKWRFIEG